MPRITVDGIEIEVPEGRTILQALDDVGLLMNGVTIPHYCWHPKLTIDGSCRLCQVEVEGAPKLQIACNTPVRDGMVIRTDSEKVIEARQGVMELLLVNHPLDCPICDQAGECKLQDYAYEYGVVESRTREPRRAAKKNVDLGPNVVFDQERCILCRRCVRFCREVPQTGELCVVGRGDRSVIETFPDVPLDNDYSMNVADICPVGALTTKDFRFRIRVWFLDDIPGICTGCANGCNVHIGVANNRVYRYQPRRNDEVNETWICDEGRLSYRKISAADRIKQPMLRHASGAAEAASADAAIREAARRISSLIETKGVGVIAGVASPHATNEDLFVFRRFLDALGVEAACVPVERGHSDALLIKEEKAANATGARALGFGAPEPVMDRIRSGGIDAVIALGHDLLSPQLLDGASALEGADTVILLDSHVSELARVAHVLFPTRVAAEKHGTLTNFAGRVQRVRPAVEPSWTAVSEGEILARLGAALGLDGFDGRFDVREVGKALSAALPSFEGIDLETVGDA
ncbi:MAG TPA: 2Fe-2S iron-sulfur cluster-binding protein, partial [Myxococcota bacterium]